MASVAKVADKKKKENEGKEETKEQRIERLKSRLAHLTRRPYYEGHLDLSSENLARWLDASDNCVLLAAARLRANIEKAKTVRKIVSAPTFAPTTVIKRHLGGGMCGVDRQGSLVYFLLFGLTDMLGIVQSCSREQFMVYWAHHIQAMIDELKSQSGKEMVHNILLIIDLKDCTNRSLTWTGMVGWAKAAQNYEDLNPGLLKEIILIHPPNSLPVIHKVIKSYIKPSTRRKVVVIGGANTLRHLLFRIEKHEIPAYLGGYKCDVDNDPLCRTFLNYPERVPRWSYYSNPSLPADVYDVAVQAGTVFKIDVPISVADARITWILFNVTHPITLELLPPAQPPAPDRCRNPLVRPRPLYTTRLDDQRVQQGGVVSCSVPGVYSLVLDNRKNMILMVRAKVKVNAIAPKGYLGKFVEQTPMGDSVNFYEPVTLKERMQRKELYEACTTCDANAVHCYY